MLLQKGIKETKQNNYLLLKKLKIQHHGHIRSKILMVKKLLKVFMDRK